MKSQNRILLLLCAMLMLQLTFLNTDAIMLNQTPSFGSTPSDTEITVNDSLSLTWEVTNYQNTDYELYMTLNSGNNTLVGEGPMTIPIVRIDLDHLVEGEFEFGLSIIYSGGKVWSNVTITVTGAESSSSDGDSDSGFLPGFTFYIGLLVFAVLIWVKRVSYRITN